MHPSFVSFALGIFVLFGMAALGVDGSYLYFMKVGTRSAADLSALSAAWDLPDSPGAATSAARNFASKNGFTHGVNGVTVDVTTPYKGDAERIEVLITYPASTFFASVLGIFNVNVRGRAVAGAESVGGYGIYAGYNSCPDDDYGTNTTIDWSGNNIVALGFVHSNSGIKVGGQNNRFGPTTYVCPGGLTPGDATNTYQSIANTGTKPYPASFTPGQFCPGTFNDPDDFDLNSNGPWWVGGNKDSKQLVSGVYCALNGKLTLSNQDTTGNVTFVARQIEISGSNITLTPYRDGMLLFSSNTSSPGDGAIKVSGSGGFIRGILFTCPPGETFFTCPSQVDLAGSSGFSANVSIFAGRIKVSGSSWTLTSFGAGGTRRPRLLE